ncbi:Oidioi.mRNA.OKI2018_I69.chr2.g5956.t1.cds [Oikopleura dioica]|uniref:Oidioi.mRNA.OKI2018_I69.chr2.g5956.t1.cds n=1 Tax=Oikopleura dioica TaxID=34765 RepID=A0ABN7T7L8_OIKDI|nr:Oidioi.mRNA.OKI2018_I69.chr2.g5956.t1.cds [Oikopleura dioica]
MVRLGILLLKFLEAADEEVSFDSVCERSYAICSLHGLDIRPKSYETDVEKVPLADALKSLRGSHLEKTVGSIGLLWDSHEIQRPALNCAKCPFHNSGRLSRGVREECDKCFECLSFHLEKVGNRMEDCCRRKTLPSAVCDEIEDIEEDSTVKFTSEFVTKNRYNDLANDFLDDADLFSFDMFALNEFSSGLLHRENAHLPKTTFHHHCLPEADCMVECEAMGAGKGFWYRQENSSDEGCCECLDPEIKRLANYQDFKKPLCKYCPVE